MGSNQASGQAKTLVIDGTWVLSNTFLPPHLLALSLIAETCLSPQGHVLNLSSESWEVKAFGFQSSGSSCILRPFLKAGLNLSMVVIQVRMPAW